MKQHLHCSIVRGSAPGQGLHVRISEARHLEILFGLQDVGESRHQSHGRLCLKQHNRSEHTELWMKSLVHEQFNSHFLDLIHEDNFVTELHMIYNPI